MGSISLLRGDFTSAEREYRSAVELPDVENQRGAHGMLAMLYVAQGRFRKAREEASFTWPARWAEGVVEEAAGRYDQAVEALQVAAADPALVADGSWRFFKLSLGLALLARDDYAGVEKARGAFKAEMGGLFDRPAARYDLVLSGATAARRGDGRTAVADLERAASMMPHRCNSSDEHAGVLALLAQAYTVAGDLVKARGTYEKIVGLTTGRLSWGAVYARSFYNLGLIAERQGDKARARERFQKFLELWKDADPGQPEVADARRRVGS